jgi:hypothetical protein
LYNKNRCFEKTLCGVLKKNGAKCFFTPKKNRVIFGVFFEKKKLRKNKLKI